MTQPIPTIDYVFLIFPFIGPREDELVEQRRITQRQAHRVFIRKAERRGSDATKINREYRGLITLVHWMPQACKQVFADDVFERPGSAPLNVHHLTYARLGHEVPKT